MAHRRGERHRLAKSKRRCLRLSKSVCCAVMWCSWPLTLHDDYLLSVQRVTGSDAARLVTVGPAIRQDLTMLRLRSIRLTLRRPFDVLAAQLAAAAQHDR